LWFCYAKVFHKKPTYNLRLSLTLWEKGVAMGLIEAIIIGVQFKRLEKPIVFLSMLVCFLAFCAFGVAIILAGVEGFSDGKSFLASVGFSSFSFIFFGLAALCGHFIKKCIR
jgi:hypothetical protein